MGKRLSCALFLTVGNLENDKLQVFNLSAFNYLVVTLVFFQIPLGILNVVAAEIFCLVGAGVLYELGWNAAPEFMGTYLGVLQNEGTCRHYCTFANVAMVE